MAYPGLCTKSLNQHCLCRRFPLATVSKSPSHMMMIRALYQLCLVLALLGVPPSVSAEETHSLDAETFPARNGKSKQHLVVLSHGLHGTPKSLEDVLLKLIDRHGPCHLAPWIQSPDESEADVPFSLSQEVYFCPNSQMVLYNSHANTGPNGRLDSIVYTSRGIENGGAELSYAIEKLIEREPSINSLSMIGLSLGGLYCRYAIGLLHEKFGENIRFRHFVTIATPHIGTRRHINWLYEAAVDLGLLGKTGREVMLKDTDSPSSVPLLVNMTQMDGAFWKGLNRFENLVSFGNSDADDKVPFWSSSLLAYPPHLTALENRCRGNNSALKDTTLHTFRKLRQEKLELHTCFRCYDLVKYPHVLGNSSYSFSKAGSGSKHQCQDPSMNGESSEEVLSLVKRGLRVAWSKVDPYAPSHERAMASKLKLLRTPWKIVHVNFQTFGGLLLNHMRIVNRPLLLTQDIGSDVTSHVVDHITA
eukprot:gb/GECG01007792.1/.p1 GENE.gb/GECG01007792.1/~~gb/GECG01007792.1/.p1  ORF type:complete len:475 (+),score=34.29 gb/GECG01007792.1/:1-1425(+)